MTVDQLGGRILRESGVDFDEGKNYHWLVKSQYCGYAHFYLSKCWNNLNKINEADEYIYHRLVGIDSVLGTIASIQLNCCLLFTTRWNIIEV